MSALLNFPYPSGMVLSSLAYQGPVLLATLASGPLAVSDFSLPSGLTVQIHHQSSHLHRASSLFSTFYLLIPEVMGKCLPLSSLPVMLCAAEPTWYRTAAGHLPAAGPWKQGHQQATTSVQQRHPHDSGGRGRDKKVRWKNMA